MDHKVQKYECTYDLYYDHTYYDNGNLRNVNFFMLIVYIYVATYVVINIIQATARLLCTLLNGSLIPTFYKLNIHAGMYICNYGILSFIVS